MSLGEKICYYRKLNGYTQEELATLLNVSRQSVYKWEANLSRPSLDKLKRLTEILAIDYNILLG